MSIYLLIKEVEQPTFEDNCGEQALPWSEVIGVYEDRARAETEKAHLDEAEAENKELEDLMLDPVSYYIEERPLLQ